MLRITTSETAEAIHLRLEGKLTGAWVAELDQLYFDKKNRQGVRSMVLDLKELTGADAAGRYLLALIQREGAAIENAHPLLAGWWAERG